MDKDRLIEQIMPAQEAPSGFAHRVMRAAHQAPEKPRASRPGTVRLAVAIAAAAGLCSLAVLVLTRRHEAGGSALTGHVVAGDRMTVALADRAVAVTEPGAELSWRLEGGAVSVDQPRGEAFFRVEHGGPFTVRTPAAEVRVTGTCFWVKVVPGRLKNSDAGPSLEVDVLEGGVLVRNVRGQVSLGPGGRVDVPAGEAPRAVGVRRAALGLRDRASEDRSAALESRVSELERVLEQKGLRPDDTIPPLSGRVFDFTAQDLRTLARRCEIRYYLPRHLTALAPPYVDSSFPLTAPEREAVNRLMQEQRQSFIDELRAVYIELTGERSAAETLTPKSLKEEIFAKATEDDMKEGRRRIFLEWMGEVAPPADLSTRPSIERFLRLLVNSGPDFHRAVTAVVGPERARLIRARTTSDKIFDDTQVETCEFTTTPIHKKP